ncbi:MAG TPA: DegT/DnrJ/EryC1/StrS family aminotransferase [Candidatus Eisenbacteria bacterium]|nr:DegT/DnrJ/EryC1/StrS family aminotransferase [Candidatus Eisenbacteria bacterium]
MATDSIPFHRPSVTQAELDAVASVLRSGWLTTGPRVKDLESAVAAYVAPPSDVAGAGAALARSVSVDPLHAVAVSSCTAALHLSLIAAGVKDGDEVITSPYTFVATGETILYGGARPVFVDVEPGTKNMDPARIPAAITPRTRAIVSVSIAGHPCRGAEIAAIAHHHRLTVIEDAAHSLTSRVWDVPVGTQADITCFSFYATKGVTAGEGGMVVTGRGEWAERIRRLSLHGLSAAAWGRYDRGGWWEYDVTELGYKYNMTDIQAALALAQLGRAEWMRSRREAIAERYSRLLEDCEGVRVPRVAEGMRHAWHLYQIEVPDARRTPLALALREDGIGTSVHFKPLHLFPWYQERLGVRAGQFPVAERVYDETLSLPIWPDMTDAQVDRVAERVRFHMGAFD